METVKAIPAILGFHQENVMRSGTDLADPLQQMELEQADRFLALRAGVLLPGVERGVSIAPRAAPSAPAALVALAAH